MIPRTRSVILIVLAACGGDSTSPSVVTVTPVDGATEVWLHDPITVTFSEPIDPDTVTATSVAVTADDGTLLASTPTLGEDGTVMTIQIADVAAMRGTASLTLGAELADLSGNPLVPASVSWTLPAWCRAEQSGVTPSIAIADSGRVFAAWGVGAAGAHRVVVSELGASGWIAMGAELGARDSMLPSLTFDAQNRPIVVWTEFGTDVQSAVQAARWDGAAWQALASPGEGSFVVAARQPGGDPAIAYTASVALSGQTLVRVRRLVGDAWEQVGNDVPVNGAVEGLPQIAMISPTSPVLVFADTGSLSPATKPTPVLRILRWTGSWDEVSPIALGSPRQNEFNRAAVATYGGDVYVAYDMYNGFSYGVYVVRVEGSTWRPVGGELDVDSPGDAQAPALAIDADGTPVVAWRELVEGNWRGLVARWDGTTWRAVAGGAWNADPLRAIVRPVMALAHGRPPVIAWGDIDRQSAAAIHVARWNGPATPSFGLDARASINGCAFDGTQLTLSATGCFAIANGRAMPHPGLIPFDVVSELWSDGARKRRWIALPDGQMMTSPPSGAWTAPPGTMLIKEFAIETTIGDPRTRRVMETRFLITSSAGAWRGFSFKWRPDGSDADLLPDAETTFDWPLDNGSFHTHSYPSRQQCVRCHHPSNGPLLGVRTGQLARRFDYDGVMADQLETMVHIGAIAPPAEVQPFVSPHDASRSLEQRMRGYVAANCAHCHNPAGERPTRDFRWETPLAQTLLCGPDSEVVAGDPAASVIYQRISTRVGGMPPLATRETDPLAIDVIGRWITNETNCQ